MNAPKTLTREQALATVNKMRATKAEKEALMRHWDNGDRNARFAVMALHKQRNPK